MFGAADLARISMGVGWADKDVMGTYLLRHVYNALESCIAAHRSALLLRQVSAEHASRRGRGVLRTDESPSRHKHAQIESNETRSIPSTEHAATRPYEITRRLWG